MVLHACTVWLGAPPPTLALVITLYSWSPCNRDHLVLVITLYSWSPCTRDHLVLVITLYSWSPCTRDHLVLVITQPIVINDPMPVRPDQCVPERSYWELVRYKPMDVMFLVRYVPWMSCSLNTMSLGRHVSCMIYPLDELLETCMICPKDGMFLVWYVPWTTCPPTINIHPLKGQ